MAWGLIPVCTPQSGYDDEAGVVNVPLDDLPGALAVLQRLQSSDDAGQRAMKVANNARLEAHFTWGRFAEQVAAAAALPTARRTPSAVSATSCACAGRS